MQSAKVCEHQHSHMLGHGAAQGQVQVVTAYKALDVDIIISQEHALQKGNSAQRASQ